MAVRCTYTYQNNNLIYPNGADSRKHWEWGGGQKYIYIFLNRERQYFSFSQ